MTNVELPIPIPNKILVKLVKHNFEIIQEFISEGDISALEWLVQHGLSINHIWMVGKTQQSFLNFLCSNYHSNNNQNNIKNQNWSDFIKWIFQHKGELDYNQIINGISPLSLLMQGSASINKEIFKNLIEGLDFTLRIPNSFNDSLLDLAIRKKYPIWGSQVLLEAGYSPNLSGRTGLISLHHAIRNRDPEVIKLLLQYHVNCEAQDNAGNTPLHYCFMNKHYLEFEIIKKILNPNNLFLLNKEQQNILHLLLRDYDPNIQRILDFLLEIDIENNLMDQKALNLIITQELIPLNIIKNLINRIFLSTKSKTKLDPTQTPYLLYNFLNGKSLTQICNSQETYQVLIEIIEKLLEFGADPNMIDNSGRNVFHLLTSHKGNPMPNELPKFLKYLLGLGIPIIMDKSRNYPIILSRDDLKFFYSDTRSRYLVLIMKDFITFMKIYLKNIYKTEYQKELIFKSIRESAPVASASAPPASALLASAPPASAHPASAPPASAHPASAPPASAHLASGIKDRVIEKLNKIYQSPNYITDPIIYNHLSQEDYLKKIWSYGIGAQDLGDHRDSIWYQQLKNISNNIHKNIKKAVNVPFLS